MRMKMMKRSLRKSVITYKITVNILHVRKENADFSWLTGKLLNGTSIEIVTWS